MALKISLLGSPQVAVDGEPIAVDTRKAIALIAYLAVSGQAHQRDHLAALLWPDLGQSRARAALRRTLSTLNGALRGGWLLVTRDTIGLRTSEHLDVDVRQFRAAIDRASDVPEGSRGALEQAVGMYRGDFMEGFHLRDSPEFDDWRYLESESLRRDLAWALDRLSSMRGEDGDFEAATSLALRWLALDPLHEEAHRRLMLLHARSGQTAAAVRQYRDCVRILERELGVEPLEATTSLYQAIQERREPPAAGAVDHAVSPNDAGPVAPAVSRAAYSTYPFVGREREIASLQAAYMAAGSGGHLVVIEGEAGVGKTRLVQTFLGRLQERGSGALTLRCYEGEGQLTFGPFIDALKPILLDPESDRTPAGVPARILSEASRLFPELIAIRPEIPDPVPLDSPGARARFYDALLDALQHALGNDGPGALFIDDVQWIDGASLDLLAYLVHRLQGRPLVVLAWRGDMVPAEHRLRGLLASALRDGTATLVTPGRLQQPEVEALVREVAANLAAESAGFGERLFRETDGLPFFVVQYLDELRQRRDSPESDSWPLPGGVRDLLRARVAALPADELQILTTLSAIGATASFDVLAVASGRSEEEVVSALDHLIGRGLVSERDGGSPARREPLYGVSHDTLRELVYAETSFLRRRLLHRRIAGALRRSASGQPQRAEFARIANHLRLAGQDDEAARAYREAGDIAAQLYANAEAVGHYEAALALGYEDAAWLYERIGDLQTRMGAYDPALAAYEKAAALCPAEASGPIEHKLGNLYHRLGEWTLAERHYSAAEPLLAANCATSSLSDLARLIADWSLTAHRRGDQERARWLGRRALELAGQAGDLRALAQSHNLLGILARNAGDPAAREHLEESLRAAQSSGASDAHMAALNNLALLEHEAGNHELAIRFGREALSLAVLQGARHREAALHSNLADYLHGAGQTEQSMEHLRASAVIYAEIGIVAGERQAEIWKLAEW